MKLQNVLFTTEGRIGRISINRPWKKNALNLTIRKELKEILEQVRHDEKLSILVITGSGDDVFVSGSDVNDLKDPAPIEVLGFIDKYGQKLYAEFENLPIPVIALIKGYCLGAGCELAMACDIRVASPDSKFGFPELRLGIIPGGGGTQRLPRLVGMGRAKELILVGSIIDAKEAERIGLINKVVSRDDIDDYVNRLAQKIMSQGPIAVKMAKLALNESFQGPIDLGLKIESLCEGICFSTRDKKEGLHAFIERRKPHFTNK